MSKKKSKFAPERFTPDQTMDQHHTEEESHHLTEPTENEIAGPVILALTILGLIIVIIYFWAQ